jgi:IS5 family transposase
MRDIDTQFTFADLGFLNQGVRMDPLLAQISDLLDEQAEPIATVSRQLNHGLKKPHTGRSGLTASQVLRSLILMRIKNWDYRELAERIADGYMLRQFTRFYGGRVPKHDAFNRAFNRLTPATLEAVNDLILEAAVAAGLEDGAKMRADTTVVQVSIHWPTDATLLWDVVRVISRSVDYLGKILPQAVYGVSLICIYN